MSKKEKCKNPDIHKDFNPKLEYQKQFFNEKSSAIYNFLQDSNDIFEEIHDTKEVQNFYKEYKVVPYTTNNGVSCHNLLSWLDSFKRISLTQGAVHKSIRTFSFGGKIKNIRVNKSDDFVLDTIPPPLEESLQLEFIDYLCSLKLNAQGLRKLIKDIYDEYYSNGNGWLEVVISSYQKQTSVGLYSHKTKEIVFLKNKKGKKKTVLFSKSFDEDYLKNNPPKKLNIYPDFNEEKVNGVKIFRTLLHIKQGNYEYYGKPTWLNGFITAFREWKIEGHKTKQANKNFQAQVFIEFEDSDVENDEALDNEDAYDNGFEGVIDRLHQNFTAEADDLSTIFATTRPYGTKPTFIHEFKPYLNENYFKIEGEQNRLSIIIANSWSSRLMGEIGSTGWNTEIFLDELKIKEKSILQELRTDICGVFNKALQIINEKTNNKKFEGLGITFISPFYNELNPVKNIDLNKLKDKFTAYGTGVRAGTLTPNVSDEEHFRNILELPEMCDEIKQCWNEDKRRIPITLKSKDEINNNSNNVINEDVDED